MATTTDIGAMFGAGKADTFFGLPKCTEPQGFAGSAVIVGALSATPYPSVGAYCAGGPAAIRAAVGASAANLGHVEFDTGGPGWAASAGPLRPPCGGPPRCPMSPASCRSASAPSGRLAPATSPMPMPG